MYSCSLARSLAQAWLDPSRHGYRDSDRRWGGGERGIGGTEGQGEDNGGYHDGDDDDMMIVMTMATIMAIMKSL